jgi:hypothetical protein
VTDESRLAALRDESTTMLVAALEPEQRHAADVEQHDQQFVGEG